MSYIKLNSGKYYDFIKPDVSMIDINDIAHNLSKEQRFANCLKDNWSVLQHVLLVRDLVELEGGSTKEQYIALHHDDPEAYMGDVPTPLKNILRDYQKFYRRCANTISEKFDIGNDLLDLPERVEGWDKQVMLIEDVLFSPTNSEWHQFDYEAYKSLNESTDNKLEELVAELLTSPPYKLRQIYIRKHHQLKEELEL